MGSGRSRGYPHLPARMTPRSVAIGHSARRRRHSSGERPTHFLKARLNAASDSKPTAAATETTLALSSISSRLANCMRRCLRYCIGGPPTKCTKRSASTERDVPASSASASSVQLCAGCIVQQRQRSRDQRFAQPGEPAGLLTGQCLEVAAHYINEQQLGHPQPDDLSARAVLAQLVQRKRDQMGHPVPQAGRADAKKAWQRRQHWIEWPQIAAEKAADELRLARSAATFDTRRRQSAGGHVAQERHRLLVTVGALSLGRVGEVVGVTVRNDQHVTGFEALRRSPS